MGELIGLAFMGAFGLLIVSWIASAFMYICRPNEVLIFSGREHILPDGQRVGYRFYTGGFVLRRPFLESVSSMDLRNIEVEVAIKGAYSKGGIPLNVDAVANVKLSDDPNVLGNAIERLLGKKREEIALIAKQTLEGHLRGVISSLSPEEVNEDRLKFAKHLQDEAEEDLKKLGLHLDTFNIHHVTDEANYLNSVGRQKIAQIRREAEVAESNAQREASQSEAEANGTASIAIQKAETAIATKANELRRIKAELEATARSAEERAKAAAETARALAEQELQKVRAELEQKRLASDVIAPAAAENEAKAILARGDAAPIAERGKAVASSLDMQNEAWLAAGDGAMSIVLIQQLESVLKQVVARLEEVKVGSVTLIDRGDGTALPNYVASFPAAVTAVLGELAKATGLDIAGSLAGGARAGRARADGAAAVDAAGRS